MAFDDIDATATRDTLIDLLTKHIDQGIRLAVQRAATTMEAQNGTAAATCWGALSGQLIEAAVLADPYRHHSAARPEGAPGRRGPDPRRAAVALRPHRDAA